MDFLVSNVYKNILSDAVEKDHFHGGELRYLLIKRHDCIIIVLENVIEH